MAGGHRLMRSKTQEDPLINVGSHGVAGEQRLMRSRVKRHNAKANADAAISQDLQRVKHSQGETSRETRACEHCTDAMIKKQDLGVDRLSSVLTSDGLITTMQVEGSDESQEDKKEDNDK